ncbi:hypothetical protein MASR2M18_13780 [Ignavibacteria bacterium]|nr:C40 family peptidase [Bacteroidota bacterium]MCZ2132544.1 C40 family peptidase [Bacteroidota bacterium]
MNRRIPLIPFWLGLVLLAIAIALPSTNADAAPKKTRKATTVKHTKKIAAKKKISSRKKRRKGRYAARITPCNPVQGKMMAFEHINGNDELSRLAGFAGDDSEQRNEARAEEFNGESPAGALPLLKTGYVAKSNGNLPDEGEDIEELEKEDDVTVDIESFRSIWLAYMDGGGATGDIESIACGIDKKKIIDAVMDWVGTRYHFGGTGRSGIDCSAFTRAVFASAGSIMLPRTAAEQSTFGNSVRNREEMQFGDIVFFHTRRHAYVSHVGIYLGDNLFAHSSSRYGVTISSLESTYYNKRLIGVKRLGKSDLSRLAINSAYPAGE